MDWLSICVPKRFGKQKVERLDTFFDTNKKKEPTLSSYLRTLFSLGSCFGVRRFWVQVKENSSRRRGKDSERHWKSSAQTLSLSLSPESLLFWKSSSRHSTLRYSRPLPVSTEQFSFKLFFSPTCLILVLDASSHVRAATKKTSATNTRSVCGKRLQVPVTTNHVIVKRLEKWSERSHFKDRIFWGESSSFSFREGRSATQELFRSSRTHFLHLFLKTHHHLPCLCHSSFVTQK